MGVGEGGEGTLLNPAEEEGAGECAWMLKGYLKIPAERAGSVVLNTSSRGSAEEGSAVAPCPLQKDFLWEMQ